MAELDQVVLSLIAAAGGIAGWKGLALILSRLGLGLAQNKTEEGALARISAELDKANARADAANARAIIADDRAAKAVGDMAEMRALLDKLKYQIEQQNLTIERQAKAMNGMEGELKTLREMVRHEKYL